MISVELVLLGVVASIVLWALGAARLSRTLITLPMIFTAVGYGVTYPVGMLADEHALNEVARFVAEVTLIIVLFADASHVRFRDLSKGYGLPLRMLVIGMPVNDYSGHIGGVFHYPWWQLGRCVVNGGDFDTDGCGAGRECCGIKRCAA